MSEKYEGEDNPLILLDSEGYYYSQTWRTLLKLTRQLFVSNTNIFSTKNIQLFLDRNNTGLRIINKYISNKDKLVLIDNDGYLYTSLWGNLQKLWLPDFVNNSNEYSIQNIHLWCKLNNKSYKLLSTKYNRNSELLLWKCLKDNCGEEFKMCWNNILQGQNCGFCTGKQVGLSNCLVTKNPELASEWHPIKNGDLIPYDFTCGSGQYAWWQCKECGNEWIASIVNRNNGRGCPQCNKSKGEKRCKEVFISKNFIEILQKEYNKLFILDKYNNTYFIPQKTFNNLIGIGGSLLSYDFYIPKLNILIEYQGNFHDGTVGENAQSKEDLETQQEHDRRKREYAQKNNINLLEIWYWDYDNIEQILCQELNLPYNQDNQNNLLTKVS